MANLSQVCCNQNVAAFPFLIHLQDLVLAQVWLSSVTWAGPTETQLCRSLSTESPLPQSGRVTPGSGLVPGHRAPGHLHGIMEQLRCPALSFHHYLFCVYQSVHSSSNSLLQSVFLSSFIHTDLKMNLQEWKRFKAYTIMPAYIYILIMSRKTKYYMYVFC